MLDQNILAKFKLTPAMRRLERRPRRGNGGSRKECCQCSMACGRLHAAAGQRSAMADPTTCHDVAIHASIQVDNLTKFIPKKMPLTGTETRKVWSKPRRID